MSTFDMAEIARYILTAESPSEQQQMVEAAEEEFREAVREARVEELVRLMPLFPLDTWPRSVLKTRIAAIRKGEDK